jgi:FkbM family methyltransferase
MLKKTLKSLLKRILTPPRRHKTGEEMKVFLDKEEILRLNSLPKRSPSATKLFGKNITFPDGYWFLHSLEELFIEEVYKFTSTNPAPIILDCGANIGLSVVYFKRLFPTSSIIAFEPDKQIFDTMSSNLKGFDFKDVSLINKGVWNSQTTLSFVAEGTLGGRIANEESKNSTKIISIDTVRLKDYLEKPVDFLKLDIEGAEYEVLLDCADVLNNVRTLFIEYHSTANQPQHLDEILSIVSKAGFRYYIKEASHDVRFPFVDFKRNGFDLQLNISCYRL